MKSLNLHVFSQLFAEQGYRMDILKAMFEQLVSPEQRQLAATVVANGGVKALRNNDKMLLSLEKTASKDPIAPGDEEHRALWAKPGDGSQNADDLRTDLFEDPEAAVEKNQAVYFRKFEAQKRQIIDELTFVVQRESDRVIQELKTGPHERIRDRVCASYRSRKHVIIIQHSF